MVAFIVVKLWIHFMVVFAAVSVNSRNSCCFGRFRGPLEIVSLLVVVLIVVVFSNRRLLLWEYCTF